MKRTLIGVALCAMLVVVLFTRNSSTDSGIVEKQLFVMGTVVTISVLPPDGMSDETVGAAIAQAQAQLESINRTWSPSGDGPLGVANAALMKRSAATLPDDMSASLMLALDLHRRSRGLFDPGIGRLIDLWGFDDENDLPSAPPPASRIQPLLDAADSISKLKVNDETRSLTADQPMRLDFGAFAKGLALNFAIVALRDAGIDSAIVNAGGDLKAMGQRGDRPWRIGIRHPRPNESASQVLAALEIRGTESVITSGDYERYFVVDGRRYHHILHPKNGFPVTGAQSVTVIHEDAAIADAASTALFVASNEQWLSIAKSMSVELVMRVQADGQIVMTQAMSDRLDMRDAAQPTVVTLP